jgi:4'-phosphopantetheinyl transferase
VDVYWLEQTASDVPGGDEWLGRGEQDRLHGLRIPKRRADWRLGRWTAKCALVACLNLPGRPDVLATVEVRPSLSGAPEVFRHDQSVPLSISLSHSGGRGFCAIAPHGTQVGCDVEKVEPRSAAFLADYFTPEERLLVARTPAAKRDLALTLLWSAKESALKALHCGLREDTLSVRATPSGLLEMTSGEWRRLSVEQDGGRTSYGWWRASPDFVHTVLADPAPLRLVPAQPHLRSG